jgi:hypothetical protein
MTSRSTETIFQPSTNSSSRSDDLIARSSNKVKLETKSLRPLPGFVSPSPREFYQRVSPHSPQPLARKTQVFDPMETTPVPRGVNNQEAMDEDSEHNSIMSENSGDTHDMPVPPPPIENYGEFMEWLGYHFAAFVHEEFEQFLLQDMQLLSIQELSNFLTQLEPRSFYHAMGQEKYDKFRQPIVDLKVIWSWMQKSYPVGQRTPVSYLGFLVYRDKMLARTSALVPRSEIYRTPTPAYRAVSPAVTQESSSWRRHGSHDTHASVSQERHSSHDASFYSADVTPASWSEVLRPQSSNARKSPTDKTRPARPKYEPSLPRMIFSDSEHESSKSGRKPSKSSLFSDRYAQRAESSYVPPYAKSTRNEPSYVSSYAMSTTSSERTPKRSGCADKRPLTQDSYENATVLSESYHSSRSKSQSSRSTRSKTESARSNANCDVIMDHGGYYKSPSMPVKDDDNSGHSSTRSTRSSRRNPHHKAAKSRAKLNEKVYWDGYTASFLAFRRAIEGHLLQVGAGYLLDAHFLYHYKLDPTMCQLESRYSTSHEIWICHRQSCHQIRYDTEYFYGMLVSACRNISNKTITRHSKDRDGILAWEQLRADFDNEGSKTLRLETLEDIVGTAYQANQVGGLSSYIDQFMNAMHELEMLGEEEYTDIQKKRTLMKNIRGVPGITHLVTNCKDKFDTFTFETMAQYLRDHSKTVEKEPSSKKRVMTTIGEEDDSKSYRSWQETKDLFEAVARESNIFQAYRSFDNRSMRQSLNIHDDIWKALEPAIQDKIKAVREKVKANMQANRQENNKSSNPGGIPAQYPTMKASNLVDTKDGESPHAAMVALCEKLGDLTTMDDYETDDDECMRQMYMVSSLATNTCHEEEDIITIRAHLEYTKNADRHYAISDSGADSSILGLNCHVIAHTGRHAYLIGYDPATTKSAKIPIVSGYIKVMSQVHIPIVLQINEAPYNANSPVTLLSEYQARDHGTIIDSVSRRHKTISGSYGTQRMMVSPHVYVPFVDRGGLMGFEILPWKEGDEERYEVFEITSDAKWTPRRYLEDSHNSQKPGHRDILSTSQDNVEPNSPEDSFQDASQDEENEFPPEVQDDPQEDSVGPQDDPEGPQEESSVVDDDSIPSIKSCESDPMNDPEDIPCNVTLNVACGMVPPIPIVEFGFNSMPYHYDPEDDALDSHGHMWWTNS